MKKKKTSGPLASTLKEIGKIISWVAVTVLVIFILFLLLIVVTTKVNEKMGKDPVFALYTIISPSMVPNIEVYDVVFVAKTNTKNLVRGDIISFYVTNSSFGNIPVTHRIIDVIETQSGENRYVTKGDYNPNVDDWRNPVFESDVVGKVLFRIPQLGKIQFFITSKKGWIAVILLPALGIIAFDLFKLLKLIILKSKITPGEKVKTAVKKEESNVKI